MNASIDQERKVPLAEIGHITPDQYPYELQSLEEVFVDLDRDLEDFNPEPRQYEHVVDGTTVTTEVKPLGLTVRIGGELPGRFIDLETVGLTSKNMIGGADFGIAVKDSEGAVLDIFGLPDGQDYSFGRETPGVGRGLSESNSLPLTVSGDHIGFRVDATRLTVTNHRPPNLTSLRNTEAIERRITSSIPGRRVADADLSVRALTKLAKHRADRIDGGIN